MELYTYMQLHGSDLNMFRVHEPMEMTRLRGRRLRCERRGGECTAIAYGIWEGGLKVPKETQFEGFPWREKK